MAAQLELATNQLTRELSAGLPAMLAAVDAEMHAEDVAMQAILGDDTAPFPTPLPITWLTGEMPLFTALPIESYPTIAMSGTTERPTLVQGGDWQQALVEFLVQVICVSNSTVFLYRFLNRYADSIQRVIKNSTLNGLTEPIQTAGRIDLSRAQFREHDDANNAYYAQSMMYRFQCEFVVT